MVYDISYKILIGEKPLSIRFDRLNRVIGVDDGTRYLVLFSCEKYYANYNRIKYLTNQKSGITYINYHNYARIKIDSYYSLPLEKALFLHHVIILIKSALNKNKITTTVIYP